MRACGLRGEDRPVTAGAAVGEAEGGAHPAQSGPCWARADGQGVAPPMRHRSRRGHCCWPPGTRQPRRRGRGTGGGGWRWMRNGLRGALPRAPPAGLALGAGGADGRGVSGHRGIIARTEALRGGASPLLGASVGPGRGGCAVGPGAAPSPRLAWPLPPGAEVNGGRGAGRLGGAVLPQEQHEGRSKLGVYELQGHRPERASGGVGQAWGSRDPG